MINKVEFRNFKALRDLSLDLERLTVLVGPNGSGKTSILEGLHCLAEFGCEEAIEVSPQVRIPLDVRTSGADGSISLCCLGEEAKKEIIVGADEVSVSVRGPGVGGKDLVTYEAYRKGARLTQVKVNGSPLYGPAVLLRLDLNRLAEPSYSQLPVPKMAPDGHGLASVLEYLASDHPEQFTRIMEALRSVVPIVHDVRFPRAKIVREETELIKVDGKEFSRRADREYWGNSIEFDMEGAPRISAARVSEGTMLALGLLTTLMGPHRPRLALLDDLDRALHPKAQESVVILLRRLLEEDPDMQIVATSHSPYLLHHLEPEEVRLTALREDGSVICGRLDEHPEFEKWREEMTPGELWSLFGEKWLEGAKAGEQP